MPTFDLGNILRDKITGFEGVCVGRHTFLSGTIQYGVLSRERNEKGEDKQVGVDWQFLEYVDSGPLPPPELPVDLPNFDLGDVVQDTITDFSGTVTSKSEFINGCVQYGVQPRALDKGDMVKPRLIDCQRLRLLEKATAASGKPGGGPEYMPI